MTLCHTSTTIIRWDVKKMEKKISLRVSDDKLDVIDSFISRHDFSNRSEFLRKAALEYIRKHDTPAGQKEIPEKISLPDHFRNVIMYLIEVGHYNNWQDAIHELVREALLQEDIEDLKKQYTAVGELTNKVESYKNIAEKESDFMKR